MPFTLVGPRKRAALFCAVLPALLVTPGCGKKGPPLPPLRIRPEQVEALRVRQIGDKLTISMERPRSRHDGTALGEDVRLEIMMSAKQPAAKSGKEVTVSHSLKWSIPVTSWNLYAQGKRLDVNLSLSRIAEGLSRSDEADSLIGKTLSFAAQVVESRKKRSPPSNLSKLTVCAPPPAPRHVAGRLVEDGLLITWDPGEGPVQGAAAYNIFRHEPDGPRPDLPLSSRPSSERSFLDTSAAYDKQYIYSVRTMAAGQAGCESSEGAPVAATRKDIFPPAPPEGLAAVAEKGAIRLFWRPSRDEDLRGYLVYRADGESGAMRPLTHEMLTTTTYTDEDVSEGVVYSYAVTAVDGASPRNESAFSIEAVESLESR